MLRARYSAPKTAGRQTQQEFLRQSMERLGMTRSEFADRLGMKVRSLDNWLLPSDTKEFRSMPDMAWRFIEDILQGFERGRRRKGPLIALAEAVSFAEGLAASAAQDVEHAARMAKKWFEAANYVDEDDLSLGLTRYLERRWSGPRTTRRVMADALLVALGDIEHTCGADPAPAHELKPHLYVDGCLACDVLQEAVSRVGDMRDVRNLTKPDLPSHWPTASLGEIAIPNGLGVEKLSVFPAAAKRTRIVVRDLMSEAQVVVSTAEVNRLISVLEIALSRGPDEETSGRVVKRKPEPEPQLGESADDEKVVQQLRLNTEFLRRLPRSPITAELIQMNEVFLGE